MKVYQAIAAVQGELAKVGIAKNRKNTQGSGYMFRGIDDVYSALSPLLSKHGLCVIPRVLERACEDRQSKSGGTLFYVTVRAEFDFVSSEDGSIHTAATFGEAMDSGDKATNKAMSAAYKYAAFMTFAIPTEGDNDADATTHQIAPANDAPKKREPAWGGAYSGKSALHRGLSLVDRTIRGCGDSAELDAYLNSAEWQDFQWSAEKYAPHYLHGGHPDQPEEFVPLLELIKQRRNEFEQAEQARDFDVRGAENINAG